MNELTQRFAQQVAVHIEHDGMNTTELKALSFFRASRPTRCDANIYKPSFILTLQGVKSLSLQGENQEFVAGQCLVASVDMPITSNIVDASEQKPYLCLVFELDMDVLVSVMPTIQVNPQTEAADMPAVTINSPTDELMDVMRRMLDLLDNPSDVPVLYPMLERELAYRLLNTPMGARLRHLCSYDSSSSKIMRAVQYLNEHFHCPIKVETLANEVNMSVSSLHQHFKTITMLSPLQFQKKLRLYEARRLIMQGMEISSAAYRVGYESASQFSRDYGRTFGVAPSLDRNTQNIPESTINHQTLA
ncbi:AraC family transcriptional regulator N-terminal domain-containing protein [Vibrio olivae]|uniref:AraC family transcriptional regulator N-terminal domain-containing protein n=1 Tax=Vibrio olivae TaxID=1243002 RepID=A0ABV5HS40_9VIBR